MTLEQIISESILFRLTCALCLDFHYVDVMLKRELTLFGFCMRWGDL